MEAKLARVRAWLEAGDAGAVLLTSQAAFAWITAGGRNHVALGEEAGIAWVLVTSDAAHLLTSTIELPRMLDEEVRGLPLDAVAFPWHDQARAVDLVAERCDLSAAVSELGTLGLPRADPSLVALRHTLVEPEVQRYRELGRDAGTAVEAVTRSVTVGDAELEVAGRLAEECLRHDILPLVNLVAADGRIDRYRHPIPTGERMSRRMMVVLSGRRHGLWASCTRLVHLGPVDDELLRRHRAAMAVDTRLILESRPGALLGEVLQAGIDQYAAEGFADEWQLHHQGGLAGYASREVVATPGSGVRLGADQVVAWNPSVTGTKSEDTVLVTEAGPELLTRTGAWPETEIELDRGSIARPLLLT